ncbi:MAG: serine/threonine-protein kinase [bacterium]
MDDGSLTGKLIGGRFRLKHLLGEGALGEVYLAEHETLQALYAVKVLQEHVATDDIIVKRFKREAYAASRLNHPNAVQIYDFGRTEEGQFYLVMEYAEGESLADIIAAATPRPLARRRGMRILIQIAKAMGAAHEAGIVHRDLSPANVRIAQHRGDEDLAKILDFGLAKVLASDAENPLSVMGEIFGTPPYMSPEQAKGEQVDERTDIYSLGVLAFELFTGRTPFVYKLLPQMLTAHMEEPPPRPSSLLPIEIPPLSHTLEEVILRCLAKTPAERPASAREILDVLEAELAEEPPARAVPANVAKALDTGRPGSSWTSVTSTWKPGDYAPTIPQGTSALDSLAMHPGDPAYRIWYWNQAIKLATTIGERLLRDELAPPGLDELLDATLSAEDAAISAEAEVALAESSLDDIEIEIQEKAAGLRGEIVNLSMTLDSLAGAELVATGPHAELYQEIQTLEHQLAGFRREAVTRQHELEALLAVRRAALDQRQKAQMEAEVALLTALDAARPDPCPFFYKKSYETVAEMLKALRVSDGVDIPG